MSAQTPNPIVQVTGQGSVMVVPDQATVKVRVEHTGKDPIGIKRQNDNVVRAVLQFLEQSGIEAKNIMTDYIRLSKNYEYNTKTYNYAANQAITIQIKDLDTYETVMNGLLSSGINRIDGISFGSSEQATLESQARKKAMANAKMKAEEYAGSLGQSIGKAVVISEQSQSSGPQPMGNYRLASMESADASPAMAPGELEIKVSIHVTFVLN
ncbi:MAG: SIMPL domain-containing protein [Gilvibacter sp.]